MIDIEKAELTPKEYEELNKGLWDAFRYAVADRYKPEAQQAAAQLSNAILKLRAHKPPGLK